jgi:hypothetical protein
VRIAGEATRPGEVVGFFYSHETIPVLSHAAARLRFPTMICCKAISGCRYRLVSQCKSDDDQAYQHDALHNEASTHSMQPACNGHNGRYHRDVLYDFARVACR